MKHASGNNYKMKQLAWHLLSNLQSSGDYFRKKFKNEDLWKVTLDEYHRTTATVKKNILNFINAFMFCADNKDIRDLFYPSKEQIGTEQDKTDVRHFFITSHFRYWMY